MGDIPAKSWHAEVHDNLIYPKWPSPGSKAQMLQDPTMGPEVEDSEKGQLLTRFFPLFSQLSNKKTIFPSWEFGIACLISSKSATGLGGIKIGSV